MIATQQQVKKDQQPSLVCQYPAANPTTAMAWFSQRLQFETDCSDVHASLQAGATDFILLDVRGEHAFAQAHVPGATNLPHRQISAQTMAAFTSNHLFVVYCAGPHCNGADQAAMKIARLGFPVKIMIGGLIGYQDEGFTIATAVAENQAPTCGC